MSFITKEPSTFINIKLTDTGRRMMALGNFNMTKAVLLDREVDYGVDNTGIYNIFDNRVMNIPDYAPDVSGFNLDGSMAFPLNNQRVVSLKQIITAQTDYSGFFTGTLNNWNLDTTVALGTNHITYATNSTNMSNGLNVIELDNPGGSRFPQIGELIFIPWVHDSGTDYMTSSQVVPATHPVLCNWYKVISANTPNIVVDRPINLSQSAAECTCFIYPDNGIETYWSSAHTQTVKMWNMNIVRTKDVMGTNTAISGHSNYVSYGSIEYNGTRKYFGFENDTPAVGFIHYTNENTGNTYAEQLLEKTFELYCPMIMWHHVGQSNGIGTSWGGSFYDFDGPSHYDAIAKTSYRDLKDSIHSSGITVGRVYHKLKLVVITDQELLIALTYKSNRNYTLPDFNVGLTTQPQYFYNSGHTGMCFSGYDYFVTYLTSSDSYADLGDSVSSLSFGHPQAMPCGYIKKIKGQTDSNGNPTYLSVSFPNPDSFPYMRDANTWSSYDGGWNANYVQILINEQLSDYNYDISTVPTDAWKRISNESTLSGNGIYWSWSYGDRSIVPGKLNNHNFDISRQDFNSGSTYQLDSGIAFHMNRLNFGDETMFHGTIRTGIMSTSFKSSITVMATSQELNSSNNPSYDKQLHSEIYITEIAILDSANQVVAVGKPTYPIRKLSGKYLGFKLEVDF